MNKPYVTLIPVVTNEKGGLMYKRKSGFQNVKVDNMQEQNVNYYCVIKSTYYYYHISKNSTRTITFDPGVVGVVAFMLSPTYTTDVMTIDIRFDGKLSPNSSKYSRDGLIWFKDYSNDVYHVKFSGWMNPFQSQIPYPTFSK